MHNSDQCLIDQYTEHYIKPAAEYLAKQVCSQVIDNPEYAHLFSDFSCYKKEVDNGKSISR